MNQNKINISESLNHIPEHVVITCDGNRRWAKKQGLQKLLGHRKGLENLEKLVESGKQLGIKYITLWVLSTENQEKRKDEIPYMMELGREFAKHFKERCLEEKIRFKHLGRKDRLPQDILDDLSDLEDRTKDFVGYTVGLALDYGGRDELIRAFNKIKAKGLEISEKIISDNLDTAGMPDPALMIRTGGQMRLSGMMPWASTYSELYFTDTLFPDFDSSELQKALDYFAGVKRNFGK